jgi:hypothetical protein
VKIVYHIGDTIGSETIVKKGILIENTQPMAIENGEEKILLDEIKYVDFIKLTGGLGTMVKLVSGFDTIFLSVPRIFIDKGTGFAIINYFKTIKAGKLLRAEMDKQNS